MSKRAYHQFMVDVDLASNTKFARLKDSEKLCVLLGVWPIAAKHQPRGYLGVAGQPATPRDIAHHARCSIAVASSTLHRMGELRMVELDESGLPYVHDWHDYNPDPAPSDLPEATRERKRKQRASHANVTRDTPVSHDPKLREEKEREEEDKQQPPAAVNERPKQHDDVDAVGCVVGEQLEGIWAEKNKRYAQERAEAEANQPGKDST